MNKGLIAVIAIIVIAGLLYVLMANKGTQEAAAPADTASQDLLNNGAVGETEDTAEIEAGAYAVATNESTVNWQGSKTLIANYRDNGVLSMEGGNLLVSEEGNVTGTIIFDMSTIAATSTGRGTGEDMLSNHLKSADFFSVEEFPTAEFTIKRSELSSEAGATHMITGDLTIKGITQEIQFPANVVMQGNQLMAAATLTLDRTKWDIRYGSDKFFDNLADNVIDDNFMVTFSLVANQQ